MSSNTQKKNWKKRELFLDFSIVLNSSPTIILLNSGREDLLKKLFKRILLPEAVLEEVTKQKDRAGLLLPELSWIEIVKTEIISDVALWNIGKGESEVISYVKSNSSLVAVIDDASARKCAETIDIQYIGTVGILLKAKKEKLISSLKTEMNELILLLATTFKGNRIVFGRKV